MTASSSDEFEHARVLASRGRRHRAIRACAAALAKDPDNRHAKALKARLDAKTRAISFDAARDVISRLIERDPNDPYLQVQYAALSVDEGNRQQAITKLRVIVSENPGDSYVRQVLAGLLGCQWATLDEAWTHWELALQAGPPLSPTYRTAAYVLARRNAPKTAKSALIGAGTAERLVVRTRALGLNPLSWIIAVLYASALALRVNGALTMGLVVAAAATLAVAWVMFASFYVGCFRCFFFWSLAPPLACSLFGLARSVPGAEWVALATFMLVSDVWMVFVRSRRKKSALRG